MTNFALRLKTLRTKHGYTQAELAEKLEISTSAVGMYEQGRREPDNTLLKRICEVFGVSADYLLAHDEGPREVEKALSDMRERLKSSGGIMFKGTPLNDEDTEKLFDAMLLAAKIMLRDTPEAEER
ncbi:MAG: helix-turn-helix transcriptional regulator [Clostridia bacterium]|nr:helix-turn-helix transcriptional regulator [Clostridia bacterium]MBR3593676.1 helix-turn-helix transcriptional regulator [Clostridia bacterium]